MTNAAHYFDGCHSLVLRQIAKRKRKRNRSKKRNRKRYGLYMRPLETLGCTWLHAFVYRMSFTLVHSMCGALTESFEIGNFDVKIVLGTIPLPFPWHSYNTRSSITLDFVHSLNVPDAVSFHNAPMHFWTATVECRLWRCAKTAIYRAESQVTGWASATD